MCSLDLQCLSGVCCKGTCRSDSETMCDSKSYYNKTKCECVEKKNDKEPCQNDIDCLGGVCLPQYENGEKLCFSGKICDDNNENCYGGNRSLDTYDQINPLHTYENGDLCVYDEQCSILRLSKTDKQR